MGNAQLLDGRRGIVVQLVFKHIQDLWQEAIFPESEILVMDHRRFGTWDSMTSVNEGLVKGKTTLASPKTPKRRGEGE